MMKIMNARKTGSGVVAIMLALIMSVAMFGLMSVSVNAASDEPMSTIDVTATRNGGARVLDTANKLTASECTNLEDEITRIGETYKFDIAIVIIQSLADFENMSVGEFARGMYEEENYGYGSNKDGIILARAVDDKKLYILPEGRGKDVYTQSEGDNLLDSVAEYLKEDDYVGAMTCYVSDVEEHLYMAANGITTTMKDRVIAGGIIFIVALIIAIIVLLVMRSSMKTIKAKRTAVNYVVPDSFHLNTERDTFLYMTTQVIEHNDNDSDSGSSPFTGGERDV